MSDETKWSPEPWRVFRLDVTGTDEFKAYAARCIDQGSPNDFYFGMIDKADGPADVFHTGNGPTSAENARRIVACVNACKGLPTEALEAGALDLAIATLHLIHECQPDKEAVAQALRAIGVIK